jgi:hypothetical protein
MKAVTASGCKERFARKKIYELEVTRSFSWNWPPNRCPETKPDEEGVSGR